MSRQTKRAEARRTAKAAKHDAHLRSRQHARRQLLEIQTLREKDGFYDGRRSVASSISPSRSRLTTRLVKKGQAYGRVIISTPLFAYHATKGWRKA